MRVTFDFALTLDGRHAGTENIKMASSMVDYKCHTVYHEIRLVVRSNVGCVPLDLTNLFDTFRPILLPTRMNFKIE